MATLRWQSGAAAVAQVQTYLFAGTWEATDVVRVVIGSKKVDFTTGSTVIATLIDTLITAWEALSSTDYPEFAEITPTRSTATLVLTGPTAAVPTTGATTAIPFTVTITPLEADLSAADAQTIEGAGTATTGTETTAPTGPDHWGDARNWSTGVKPANSDTVHFDNSNAPVRFGLTTGITAVTAHFWASYTGEIGLPKTNESGAAPYPEYRATYLAVGATTVNIGAGVGDGSGRLNLDTGSGGCTFTQYLSGTSPEQGLEAVLWKGTGTNNLHVLGGTLAVAGYGAEVATVALITLGEGGGSPFVRTGAGVTLTAVTVKGGSVVIGAGLTTLTIFAGAAQLLSGNLTTLLMYGGSFVWQGAGTITTATVGAGAAVDAEQDTKARVVTNALQLYRGCSFLARMGMTLSAGYVLNQCDADEVALRLGPNRTFTVT